MTTLGDLVRTTNTPRLPIIRDFGSWDEYVSACAQIPRCFVDDSDSPSWQGAATMAHALSFARTGEDRFTDPATDLIDRMDGMGFLSAGNTMLSAAEVGFMPIVPAALNGDPMAMLRRTEAPSLAAPVRVVVGIGGGATVSGPQLAARGAAIAAFTLALNATRPVELYGLCIVAGGRLNIPTLQLWRLETRPADVTQIAWALSSPAVHRLFGFGMADSLTGALSMSRKVPYKAGSSISSMHRQSDIVRLALELSDSDIFIPRAVQADDPLLTNPEQWVKDKLAEYAID